MNRKRAQLEALISMQETWAVELRMEMMMYEDRCDSERLRQDKPEITAWLAEGRRESLRAATSSLRSLQALIDSLAAELGEPPPYFEGLIPDGLKYRWTCRRSKEHRLVERRRLQLLLMPGGAPAQGLWTDSPSKGVIGTKTRVAGGAR